MENLLWEKVSQFLYQLHYEDTDRESSYCSKELENCRKEKEERWKRCDKILFNLAGKERQDIEDYITALEQCAYEECQQAYVQGMIDSIEILGGAGIIKSRTAVKDLLTKM